MTRIKKITSNDIKEFDRFYRANLINSITGYKPANLIGTYSEKGTANLAIFTSIVHLGADPPLLGFIQRPVDSFSHTYKNIVRNGYYTINHIHKNFIQNAHFTSAKFGVDISEFEACRLTEQQFGNFKAPFVGESLIKIGMKLIQEIPIQYNHTKLIIGQIEELYIQEDAILSDGNIDLNRVNDICVSGLYDYHRVKKIKTFPYAKTDNLPNF